VSRASTIQSTIFGSGGSRPDAGMTRQLVAAINRVAPGNPRG
jgi:hypothetical protein